MTDYKTCTHIHDDGNICNSAAVTDRNLCIHHLRHRARIMRMAQFGARGERFDLRLPPLESMFAVQSALTQLSEALAADMIELKRADRLIRVLNIASRNLLKSDKWPASPYHSDQPAPAVDLATEFGLPHDLDLDTPPELAFPPPVIGDVGAPSLSPAFGDRVGATDNCQRTTDNRFSSPMPTVDYCEHGPGCPEHTIRADYPETPELAELREIQRTQGNEAMVNRYKQQQHNRRRRHIVTSRKRYAAIALEKNMRLAAERLAERKLAERAAAKNVEPETIETRKPPPGTIQESTAATEQEVLSIA
jgi:hypothetical protein